MGVRTTKLRSACQARARLARPGPVLPAFGFGMTLGTLLLACGLGACIRAPALVVGARSTLATGDRRPVRVVLLCALDWQRPLRSAGRSATADSLGVESEVELQESGSAESPCAVAVLCEWEARARQAAVLRTLVPLPEAAP
jgi:hypothetical protein